MSRLDPSNFIYTEPEWIPEQQESTSKLHIVPDPMPPFREKPPGGPRSIDIDSVNEAAGEPKRPPLSSYIVSHEDTLGMSWQEIEALRPPYIIDGLMRRGEALLLGAESKSRKSWLAQDAGFAVAAGLPWLADEDGAHGFTTRQAHVHVIDLELNPSEMRFRFAKARGNRFDKSPEIAAAVTERLTAYSFDGMNVVNILPRITEIQATVRPGDLVIIDCFYRLVPDGNETADVAEMLEVVKRFAAETQAGVILVDHFRKAGDDKARNRFAGSFVKQASAATLVAIEVAGDDTLVLNIDARTFHGTPRVYARFNLDTYSFDRVLENEINQAKEGRAKAEAEGWLVMLWKGRPFDSPMTTADAKDLWDISRQAATPRLRQLMRRGWLGEDITGKATEWPLLPDGLAALKTTLGLV